MAERIRADEIPLTVHLSAELAKRLQAAASARNRPAEAVVIELLERSLPRSQPDGPKKGKIPFT